MSARARIHAMFTLDEAAETELDKRLDAHAAEAAAIALHAAADEIHRRVPDDERYVVKKTVVNILRRRANTVGEEATAAAATATPELTVYRASHESIVMGLYTTREAAMDHVHAVLANEEGGDVKARVIWRADDPEADEPEWECWLFDTDMADDKPTGYVVTPLEVASEYDAEADE